jgi:hypothetical protein
MKRSSLALIITFILAAASIGCNSKANAATAVDQAKSGDEEAQKVAAKFADLLISKCGDKFVVSDESANAFTTKADPNELSPNEHFLGYQWKGRVSISLEGVTTHGVFIAGSRPYENYEIFKRAGKWFFRSTPPSGIGSTYEPDILIDDMQPIRPACPVKN